MKKTINLFSLLTASSLLVMMSCNTSDYKKDETSTMTTTDTTAMNTTSNMMPDTTMHAVDTSNTMMSNNAATKTDGTTKARKGKVSSTMMTSGSKAPMNMDKQGYYSNVEVLPMYPGGQNALDNFVNSTIEYPAEASDNNVEGKVTVYFAVDEMGKVSNPKILGKPLGYGLEDEVIKAVNKMPTWTPGNIKGKNVKTYYTLPVNFKLE